MRRARARKVDDIRNRSIASRSKCDYSDDKGQQACCTHYPILLIVPMSLLQQAEPHDSWDPEREARNEEGGCKRQKVREDGDSFSNDPRNDSEDDDQNDPGRPSGDGIDVTQYGVLEHTAMDVTECHSRVDGTRNEDNRESYAKGDLRDKRSGGK